MLNIRITRPISAVTDIAPYTGWGHLKIALLLLLFFVPTSTKRKYKKVLTAATATHSVDIVF